MNDVPEKFALGETLARQLFVAEYGQTGMTWEQLGDGGHSEWERRAGRVLEGWWNPERPLVVLDLANGEMWLRESEQSIATQLAAALRSLVEPLGEVVVVNAGVMPTIVAPSMNGIIGPFNQARIALAAFDAVYGPQPETDAK